MEPLLELKNISHAYHTRGGETTALSNLSFQVFPGEFLALIGPSGCGKTTVLSIIAGLIPAESGEVLFKGKPMPKQNKELGYMLQKDLLLPFRKVADNVALPLELAGTDRKTARAEAMRYFEQFGLQGTEDRYPAQLSGGMRQRAALLRTYLFGKSVALLDEPFSALDTITKSAIHRWYLDVMEQIHLSTLFITHDIDEAILLSDRIYILSGRPGHITDEIHINVPKPRAGDFTLTPEFLAYKRQIIEAMHLS